MLFAENTIKKTKAIARAIIHPVTAATESVKTVDTGGYADYTSLSAWEGAEQADLTALDRIAIAKCRHATATSTVDTTSVTIDGWDTDATRYIKIWTDPSESYRHHGIAGTGYAIAEIMSTWGDVINVIEDYARIDGLEIFTTTDSNFKINYTGAGEIQISNNLIYDLSASKFHHIGLQDINSNSTVKIWNNIIYDCNGNSGINAYYPTGINHTFYVYNNTIVNCGNINYAAYNLYGLDGDSKIYIYNNIAQQNGGHDYWVTAYSGKIYSGNNIGQNDNSFYIDLTNSTTTFANVAVKDYRLYAKDTTAIDKGTSSITGISFTDDINGQTRSGTWDIGADEMIARPVYRSVGPGKTTALAVGTNNPMTIQGYTATFASSVPDNVGVGDVIQYDRDNNSTIDSVAFISGRTDSTHYAVQDVNGYMASSTLAGGIITADTDWSIYRAYTALNDVTGDGPGGSENSGISSAVSNFDTYSYSKNLASTTEQLNVACYANGTTADNYAYIYGTWVTSTSTYIKLYTPYLASEVGVRQRHEGKWDNKYYYMESEGGIGIYWTGYVRIEGLQVNVVSSAMYGDGIFIEPANYVYGQIYIANNIIKGTLSGSSDEHFGIAHGYAEYNYLKVYIYNNIVYGFKNPGYTAMTGIASWAGATTYSYNNTVSDCYQCYFGNSDLTHTVKNNIGMNCTIGFSDDFGAGSDYNVTDKSGAPGTHSKNGVKVKFARPEQGDFHLVSSDAVAKDAGANLSADTNLPFNTDIDGQARPAGIAWDIGADELSSQKTQVGTNPYSRFAESSLVGYWSFNGADMNWASTTAEVLDRSGNTINGNAFNSPKPSSGVVGQALKFNGIDTTVITRPFNIGNTDWTFAAWIKTDTLARNDIAFSYEGAGDRWALLCNPTPCAYNVNSDWVCGDDPVVLNDWNLVVLEGGLNTFKLYLNGNLDYNGTIGLNYSANNQELYIGYNPNDGLFLRGLIDEVRLYKRHLSDDEIKELYRAGTARLKTNTPIAPLGTQDGLVGNWTFDGSDLDWKTNTVYDASADRNAVIAFPENGVLDNFNRTSEGPPPSSSWINGSINGLKVVSNTQIQGDVDNSMNEGFWNASFGNDQEAYLTLTSPDAYSGVILRTDRALNGYYILYGGTDMGIGIDLVVDGTPSDLWDYPTSFSMSAGDSIGARVVGNFISAYYKPAAGEWTYLGGIADDTYSTGNIGAMLYYTAALGDDFGGGNATAAATGNNGNMYNLSTTTSPVSGLSGQALKFNGTNSYIEIPDSSNLDGYTAMTVCGWGKLTSYSAADHLRTMIVKPEHTAGNSASNPFYLWTLGVNPSGTIFYGISTGAADSQVNMVSLSSIFTRNAWNHMCGVYNGSTMRIYYNGVMDSGASSTSITIGNDAYSALIGGFMGAGGYEDAWNGQLDEIRLYDRALSASEIQDLYKLGQRKMKVKAR